MYRYVVWSNVSNFFKLDLNHILIDCGITLKDAYLRITIDLILLYN